MKKMKVALSGLALTMVSLLAACGQQMGPGQQHGYMMNMPFGGLIMIMVLVAIVVFIVLILKGVLKGDPSSQSPEDIIKRRYASGEINKEEYDQLKKDLSDE